MKVPTLPSYHGMRALKQGQRMLNVGLKIPKSLATCIELECPYILFLTVDSKQHCLIEECYDLKETSTNEEPLHPQAKLVSPIGGGLCIKRICVLILYI